MTDAHEPPTLRRQRQPQYLHIGFSKCASTYLRAVFRAHPKIHLVFKSGFFAPVLARGMTFDAYQALFTDEPGKVNVESDEHLTLPGVHPELGVRTTSLVEFEKVADRIKEILPDVRIIMVIRNQASLIAARYSEFLIQGGSLDFEQFASTLSGEKAGTNEHFQNYYREIIAILEARFPRDNLLILMQEFMREDTRRATAAIAAFMALGDELAPASGLRSERKSLSLAGMSLLRKVNGCLVRCPSVAGAPPTTKLPVLFYENMVRIIRALDFYVLRYFANGSSQVMSTSRRKAIQRQFRNDNLMLQEYFGCDLVKLGYLEHGSTTSRP